ncbi:MAG: DUF1127 domain-containing protein [Paracoccaceae bacterium]|nr:DUF1127 domain-containing protein [Paracoccaceae bacterium]
MLSLLITALKRLRDRRRRARELLELEKMDDRVLRDIGISRAEIDAELGGHVFTDHAATVPTQRALALDGRY